MLKDWLSVCKEDLMTQERKLSSQGYLMFMTHTHVSISVISHRTPYLGKGQEHHEDLMPVTAIHGSDGRFILYNNQLLFTDVYF